MTPEFTRVSVLLPHRLGVLTYAADPALQPGTIVEVPLAGRKVVGVVWDDPPDTAIEAGRLKAVLGPVGHRTVAPDLRRFVDFFARYTMTPRGAVIRMVLRSPDTPVERPAPKRLALSGTEPPRWTEPRLRVRAALEAGPLTRADLSKAAEVSPQVVAALLKAGTLEEVAGEAAPAGPARGEGKVPALSCEQGEAARTLADLVSGGAFAPILLEGVTGSGKTEVYFEAAAAAFAAGRQALILMPEIALTPMVVARMTERFGTAPGAWHSKRPPAERARLWRGVADGSVPVVVGARSALFLPFQSLGVLVVDEEHDPSFKQEDGVIYNARDMAVVRAQMAGAPVILSSATPSVETTVNVEKGRYQRLSLPARYGGLPAPQIGVVDLRRDTLASGQWLSTPVREAVTSALAAGEQALLFLNRRGYAPLTVCRRCGHRFHCAHCAASLVDHRLKRKLVCHHCGHQENRPEACPSCKATGTLVPCGPGVERVEEEAKNLWPQARCAVLSSDHAGGPDALVETLDQVARGEVDIIVGTQLVAKGYTFPKLQFVAVVDADLGLENGDLRAAERTFQLLTQVTGRAGRVHEGGRALLQTHAPDHPVILAMVAGDGPGFYREEARMRREAGLPPFTRLAAIIISATDRAEAHAHAANLARTAPREGVEVLGPAEAPLAVLRGRYRFRLLVRAPRSLDIQAVLAAWLEGVAVDGSVRRTVDIDPQSFL